jgi:hypothetical protein
LSINTALEEKHADIKIKVEETVEGQIAGSTGIRVYLQDN